jgi:DNA-binding FadR family transcriptional regulator
VPILEALRARDADAAAAAMHRHLMDAAELLRPMAAREAVTSAQREAGEHA